MKISTLVSCLLATPLALGAVIKRNECHQNNLYRALKRLQRDSAFCSQFLNDNNTPYPPNERNVPATTPKADVLAACNCIIGDYLGLEVAIYENPYVWSWGYPTFVHSYVATKTPWGQSTARSLGEYQVNTPAEDEPHRYGLPAPNGLVYTLNFRGYFLCPADGPFTIQVNNPDDVAFVWTGPTAQCDTQLDEKAVIAFIGESGAGKSTLLNAILDYENIVPSSGIRACTSVATEFSSKTPDMTSKFHAVIEYIDQYEFEKEAEILYQDIRESEESHYECEQQEGLSALPPSDDEEDFKLDNNPAFKRRRLSDSGTGSSAAVAKAKLKALFPGAKLNNIADMKMRIADLYHGNSFLSSGRQLIESDDESEFADEIHDWIGSHDDDESRDGPHLWPLIKVIKIHLDSEVLQSDAVLVDLPGLKDYNAARTTVAQSYMARANEIVIVSRLTRVLTDETTTALAEMGYTKQLQAFNAAKLLVEGPGVSLARLKRETITSELERAARSMHTALSRVQNECSAKVKKEVENIISPTDQLANDSVSYCNTVQKKIRKEVTYSNGAFGRMIDIVSKGVETATAFNEIKDSISAGLKELEVTLHDKNVEWSRDIGEELETNIRNWLAVSDKDEEAEHQEKEKLKLILLKFEQQIQSLVREVNSLKMDA
ncbi:hypothetical protein Dda_5544 [Drechslerella dactyloides]|uniref:Dynamin N-terminal domain-containing protein n=1 Tax=Drechslerella dactyloides TaxID=74499 RepID=A0AAD6NIZ1_DREDA|nr:hypothetical protein Dda_5544 [Drechslerella dactyloides]